MLLSFLSFLTISFCYGEVTTTTGFQAGVRLMQEEKFSEAFQSFESDFLKSDQSAALLYNWGHAAYRLGKVGHSLAMWRRALFMDPDLTMAVSAINYLYETSPLPQTEKSSWSMLKDKYLIYGSLNKYLLLNWLFFISSAYLLIRFFGKRKRALKDGLSLPPIPYVGFSLAAFFLVTLILGGLKTISALEVRATVIATSASLRTGPSSEDNLIFDIVEGQDVKVNQVQRDWVLVSVDSGTSGWVQARDLFQHTGRKLLW